MPKLLELAGLASVLGDENAAKACRSAGDVEVVVGTRKCG